MRHNNGDLQQLQSLPLEAKIIMSQRRIRDWYDYWGGEVYVSFSGGKDSTVLLDLVKKTDGIGDTPVVFVDTGLEYPQVRKFAMDRADVILRPEMRFDEVINRYGYPVPTKQIADAVEGAKRNPNSSRMARLRGEYGGRRDGQPSKFNCQKWAFLLNAPFNVSAKCCDVMKKAPFKKYEKETGRKPITGSLASESMVRHRDWMRNGCNAFNTSKPSSRPLSFWTEHDILDYIKRNNLPYASVYGEIVEKEGKLVTTGLDRTGCLFCCFGIAQEKSPNRFQQMKDTHPRQYNYCMKPVEQGGLGLHEVLDYIGVEHGWEREEVEACDSSTRQIP